MMRWEWLDAEIKRRGWKSGAELGVKEGQTLFHILEKNPLLHMVGVDIWKPTPESGDFGDLDWNHVKHMNSVLDRAVGYRNRLRIIREMTVEAAKLVEDGTLDFVFIDADHSQRAVEADIDAWKPKLKPGGVLCGHDCNWPSVRAALDNKLPNWSPTGHDRMWIDGRP